MFGERETLKEAYEYITAMAKRSDDGIVILTAVHVMMNTIAKQIEALEGETA
jgi:Rad3-related DNA helicase